MKKLALVSALLIFSANTALAGLEDGIYTVKTFTVNSVKTTLKYESGGTLCPAQYFFEAKGKRTQLFGTCTDLIKTSQKGNKIIITMPGFMGPFESEEQQTKAAKQLYQYTYYNGKITEKRIK